MAALVLVEPGTVLAFKRDRLVVRRGEVAIRQLRLQEIDRVLVYGPIHVTSRALGVLLRQGVDVTWLTAKGRYRGRLVGRESKSSPLRLQHYSRVVDPEFSRRLAASFVRGKIANQRSLLLRAQRRIRDDAVAAALARMRTARLRLSTAGSLDQIRGLEGHAAACYFGVFGRLVSNPAFSFVHRTRRPPRDPLNACLSFGYTVLGVELENLLLAAGLDPMLGFLHGVHYGRPSLALDLLEEVRPVIIDRVVLRMCNRRMLSPTDFEGERVDDPGLDCPPVVDGIAPPGREVEAAGGETTNEGNACFLGDLGRRVFFGEFYRRLRERIHYPRLGVKLDLRGVMREQVRLLVRVLTGKEEEYQPFVPR